jgi:hypothetical protein
VYNTYESWQDQVPFWSRRTIQAIFRRLECLGIVESSQKYNRSRWDKTKWYSINYGRLSELMHQTRGTESPVAGDSTAVPSTATEATLDEMLTDILDGTSTDPIDDAETSPPWLTKDSPTRTSKETLNRACVREPDAGARTPVLEVTNPVVSWGHHEKKPVNDLDVAYEAIPEAERQTWYERADQVLEATGMPEWMRITPTVKEMALRMWVGSTIPGVATG